MNNRVRSLSEPFFISDREIVELAQFAYTYYKRKGEIDRIIEYDPILTHEDILAEITYYLFKNKDKYDPRFGASKKQFAIIWSREVITRLKKDGARTRGITRNLKSPNGGNENHDETESATLIELSEEEYLLFKSKYRNLNAKSRPGRVSVQSLAYDPDDDKDRDFFERTKIDHPVTVSTEELLIMMEEENSDKNRAEKTKSSFISKIDNLLQTLRKKSRTKKLKIKTVRRSSENNNVYK